ncbi:type B 50S ribosomal protein L31 [Lolliginicoccus levis]|uniref:type B 50S ribosomal protein L31 n=1 Tax=Lolliginicoccus levis TaxID=2919542 RepID=UPI00241CC25D|nr:type B 50S ribosomal protein L31 [Lolliginicoccus levis]
MRPAIHPEYHPVVFQDANTGSMFLTRSTATSERTVSWQDGNEYPLIVVDVTAESHPFWTGAQRILDTAGRVEKFRQRYGNRARPAGARRNAGGKREELDSNGSTQA